VALTGGIATGKSYVLGRLRERGLPTIDADDVVHESFGPGDMTTRAIAREFGDEILRDDGSIDRTALAAKVFDDNSARRRLEVIVHPMVYERIAAWFETIDGPIGVASIPLLYETGHEADFDRVVVTTCSPEQQIERLLARGLTSEQARQRMAAQMPTAEKTNRADFVISTDGTRAETDAQVNELIEKLREGRSRQSSVDSRQS